LSVAVRTASSRVFPSARRQTVLPLNVMQTSQETFLNPADE